MLDPILKPLVIPLLRQGGVRLAGYGVTPGLIILGGFMAGLLGCFAVAMGAYVPGLVLIALCYAAGWMAESLNQGDDFTAYGGIVTKAIITAGFVFFFAVSEPHLSLAAAFLLFAYTGTGVSFFCWEVLVAKRGFDSLPPDSTFLHPARMIGESETLIFMTLCCLFTDAFAAFAALFAIMCWVAVAGRTWSSLQMLKDARPKDAPPA